MWEKLGKVEMSQVRKGPIGQVFGLILTNVGIDEVSIGQETFGVPETECAPVWIVKAFNKGCMLGTVSLLC